MELGIMHMGSSLGSVTTVASMGHKAAECWSGGKNTMLQPKHALPIYGTEAKQIVKREAVELVFIYVKCYQLFIKFFS